MLAVARCTLHLAKGELNQHCGLLCIACHSWKESGAAGAQQSADGVFIFDAASVTFVNATSLILSGLPNSTAYVQYPPRVNAGTFAKVYLSQHLRLKLAANQRFQGKGGGCSGGVL